MNFASIDRLFQSDSSTPHCQQCGWDGTGDQFTDADGYTTCCNERVVTTCDLLTAGGEGDCSHERRGVVR